MSASSSGADRQLADSGLLQIEFEDVKGKKRSTLVNYRCSDVCDDSAVGEACDQMNELFLEIDYFAPDMACMECIGALTRIGYRVVSVRGDIPRRIKGKYSAVILFARPV
jgi:hypothetical protein